MATLTSRLHRAEFGRLLAKHMREKGLSASDLARQIWGNTKNSNGTCGARNRDRIGNYLKAKSYPERKTMALLAKALDITVEDLAPKLPATLVDQENPEFTLTVIAGDRAIVSVNLVTDLDTALEIAKLVQRSKSVDRPKSNGAGHPQGIERHLDGGA